MRTRRVDNNEFAEICRRRVRSNQPSADTSFTTAVGEGRDFLGPGQTFMKTGLLAVRGYDLPGARRPCFLQIPLPIDPRSHQHRRP
jgi:hypothetical protein